MKVLNVAEKPSVAKEIANILSSGHSQRRQGYSQYNPIYEFPYQLQNHNVQMVVTSVTGHLMEIDFDANYRNWHSCNPADLFTAPIKKRIRSDETQKKIERTLTTEARQSQWLVLWLDCDREGENIAYEVKRICEGVNSRLRVFRAKFSALIPRDIVHAVQNLSIPNEKLSLACDARAEIDLRIGAAFTRFQTMRIQKRFPSLNKEKGVISYGPCQFPTLGFVVERYLKIQNFEKESFYSITVTHRQDNQPDAPTTTFKWKRDRLFDRLACLCIYECLAENPTGTIESIDKRPTWKRKPLPLTTVELQKRASRWLRISSEQTMKAAESLYNKGYLSYPRTETNKFKEGTDLMGLIRLHENHEQWGTYVSQQLLSGGKFEFPRHGGGDDQAHPPIHPTKCISLSSITDHNEKKVYEFVTLHFLACCSKDAKGNQTNVQMKILDEGFTASGLMIEERNYLNIYKYEKWSASAIPVYFQGDTFQPTSLTMSSGETAPPPLLSEADLIAKMDSNGIGTDATIAEHIKTILKRDYAVKVNNNTQFKPTTLGLALVLSYEQMGLDLAKPALRAAMENDCKAISLGQKDIKNVIESCMNQMKEIFFNVFRSADVMDQTFAEYFDQPVQENTSNNGWSTQYQENQRVQHLDSRESSESQQILHSSTSRPRTLNPREVANTNHDHGDPSNSVNFTGNAGDRTATRSFGNPTSNFGSENLEIPRCENHGLPCVEREVIRDGPNKGRMFFKCSLPPNEQCDFFAWVSDLNVATAGGPVIKCSGHDELCVERTVKKEGANKGRYFYSCRRNQAENCGFFQWKDEVAQISVQPSARSPFSSTSANSDRNVPRCSGHDIPCVSRITRKPGENQNREFYVCSRPASESCGFFVWKDEVQTVQRGHQTSSSARSRKRQQPANTDSESPQCDCGLPGILLTCRNGANKGRTFYKCPNQQDAQCNFFLWAT